MNKFHVHVYMIPAKAEAEVLAETEEEALKMVLEYAKNRVLDFHVSDEGFLKAEIHDPHLIKKSGEA